MTDLSLVAAYRRFVVRMSGAPVCKRDSLADSAELRARDKMVQAFNEHARKFAGSVQPISADEIRGAAQDRKLLDAQEPTFPYPPELWSAYLAFRPYIQDPSLSSAKLSELQDTVQAFLHEWERWDPAAGNHDFRAADAKLSLLVGLSGMNAPGIRSRILPELVSHLSGHFLKKEQPAIWLSYVATLIEIAGGGKSFGMNGAPDPEMLDAIRHAPDSAIQLLANLP